LTGFLAVAIPGFAGLVVAAGPAEAHGAKPVESIPDSAFLQPADLGGAVPWRPDGDVWPSLRPPKPGVDARYRSSTLLRAEGTISVLYPVADNQPTVLLEYVAKYRGAGANRYVSELRRALGGRHGRTDQDGHWTLLRAGVAGHHSLVIQLRQQFDDPDRGAIVKDIYLVVARIGRVVVMLADIGWESGSGRLQIVRDLVPAALQRASSIR
jgi:hypothetical protein